MTEPVPFYKQPMFVFCMAALGVASGALVYGLITGAEWVETVTRLGGMLLGGTP